MENPIDLTVDSYRLLSIQIETDPNNNEQSFNSKNDLLLASDFNSSYTASVIVKNYSNNLPCRPIPTDQENFFANNPNVLSTKASDLMEIEPISTHPRIAFRRISAPVVLPDQLKVNRLYNFYV